MEFIILLFIILTNAVAITNLLKRKIDLSLPISVITITLIVYLLGLFDNADVGVKIVEGLSFVATIYNIVWIAKSTKSKQMKETFKMLVTPRFASICLAIFTIHYY